VAKTATTSAAPSPPALALADEMVKAMTAAKLKLAAALLLAVGVLAASADFLARQATPPQTAGGAVKPGPGVRPSVRGDRHGDPLPEEAIARLGTARLRHGDFIEFLRFTPDGKTLVSQGVDGVRVWDAATGNQRYHFPLDASVKTFGANASLSADGRRVAVPGEFGVCLWDVGTSKLLRKVGSGTCMWPCFSPDGKTLAAFLYDRNIVDVSNDNNNRVVLWDPASGRELKAWYPGPWVNAIAFSPDGKRLLTNSVIAGTRGFFVRIWDAGTGKEQRRIKLSSLDVPRMALSPDGALLAAIVFREPERGEPSYTVIGRISLWDVTTGQFLRQLPVTIKDPEVRRGAAGWSVASVAFAPDGKTVYAGGVDGTLIGWDPRTGKEVRRVGADLRYPLALCFTPDGKTVAANLGPTIRLIDLASGADRFPELSNRGQVQHTAITPDGRVAVTVDSRHVHVWDPATGREVRRLALEPGHLLNWIRLTADGRTLIFSDIEELLKQQIKLRAWDLTSGKELRCLEWELRKGGRLLDLASDGKTLACARPGGVTLLDWKTGKELGKLPGDTWAQGAAFTSDGRRLVVWEHQSRLVQVWDLAARREIRRFALPEGKGRQSPSYTAAVSPDGRCLAYSSQSGFLALYDLSTGEEIRKWSASRAQALAFSPDGKTLAWGGYREPAVLLLELATGRERHRLTGHRGGVTALGFSADGTTLISASHDTTALTWDLTGRLAAQDAWGKPPTAAELDACWAALAGEDAARAYQAIRRLAACPAAAVPYLQARLRPAPAADEKQVARLIRDLASDRFAVRDHAAKELEKLGEAAAGVCRKALAATPPLELRRRLEALQKAHRQAWWAPAPERLRALRALEALERAGTAEAQQLLGRLAQGAPEARLTLEAQASLQRLQRHTVARPGAGSR
jgi:WD40 repeat protein